MLILTSATQPSQPLTRHVFPASLSPFNPAKLEPWPHSTAKDRDAWGRCRLASVAQLPRGREFRLPQQSHLFTKGEPGLGWRGRGRDLPKVTRG